MESFFYSRMIRAFSVMYLIIIWLFWIAMIAFRGLFGPLKKIRVLDCWLFRLSIYSYQTWILRLWVSHKLDLALSHKHPTSWMHQFFRKLEGTLGELECLNRPCQPFWQWLMDAYGYHMKVDWRCHLHGKCVSAPLSVQNNLGVKTSLLSHFGSLNYNITSCFTCGFPE